MQKNHKKVLLVVLDGWGYREEKEHNGIAEANTPFFDKLWQEYPHCLLEADGEAVGLPEGQMGNSEIGHMTIGAGKVIYTDLVKITKAAKEDQFHQNPAFKTLFDHIIRNDSVLHVKGLVSPGGIHSHSDHLYAFLKSAKESGVTKIAIHAFTDGRDTAPQSAHQYLKELEDVIEHLGIGFIATTTGRFFAMDRDSNWDRVKKAEEAIFHGKSKNQINLKPSDVIKNLHTEGIIDEHIEPIVFLDENGNSYKVNDNDGLFYFNFRKDRARALSQRIIEYKKEKNICFVTMTEYDKNFDSLIAFPSDNIETTLAGEISKAGLTQVHIAETEKFAHATYYLNGGKQNSHDNEEQILIESRRDIDTHDQAPEMRAEKITVEAIKQSDLFKDFIFVNYANADMVGHTPNKEAVIKAVEKVDNELETLISHTLKQNYYIIITADHGNAEVVYDLNSKQSHTAHTNNPVPFLLISDNQHINIEDGCLANIAPTVLELMNIPIPKDMLQRTLFKK